ncbi:MAG: flippase [Sporolactobacillus sp.]
MSNVAKNYMYNVVYQVFILVVPLITMPYIARTLSKTEVGINGYTNSLIQYFILFGTIGIALYGNRAVAYVRDDRQQLSRTFWSIFILKLLTTAVSYLLFLCFVSIAHRYHFIFILQSIYIISAAVDVTWLYMGLEDFQKTVVRNMIVKILGLIAIFLFVHRPGDLWKYVLVLALSEIIGQFTMWFYIPKTVRFVKINWSDIRQHFRPAFTLFLPQISIQIYAVLNKTMLGKLSSADQVADFDYADKIVKMLLAIVTSMGVVMLPRISHIFSQGNHEKVRAYLYQSLEFASYLAFPLMFGIAAVSRNFTAWFFTDQYHQTGLIIMLISPIVVLIAWSNVIGMQFLMPTGRMREFTVSVTAGAIVNFLANLVLIGRYQAIGTAFSTLLAEFVVTAVQFMYVYRDVHVIRLIALSWKYLFAGLAMFFTVRSIGETTANHFAVTMIQVAVGIAVYFALMFLLRADMNQKIFGMAARMLGGLLQRRRGK